jgi:hypothetical protein
MAGVAASALLDSKMAPKVSLPRHEAEPHAAAALETKRRAAHALAYLPELVCPLQQPGFDLPLFFRFPGPRMVFASWR